MLYQCKITHYFRNNSEFELQNDFSATITMELEDDEPGDLISAEEIASENCIELITAWLGESVDDWEPGHSGDTYTVTDNFHLFKIKVTTVHARN